jgi:hypothetical protein
MKRIKKKTPANLCFLIGVFNLFILNGITGKTEWMATIF